MFIPRRCLTAGFVGAAGAGMGSRLGAGPVVQLHVTALNGRKPHSTAPRALQVGARESGVTFHDMNQVLEFAKIMAVGGVAVPKYLRGNPGACIAVTLNAIEWGMTPFNVANKSYSVNDRVAYEAQLIHAVILKRAPIKGRPKSVFLGEGAKRQCRASLVRISLYDGFCRRETGAPREKKQKVLDRRLASWDSGFELLCKLIGLRRCLGERHAARDSSGAR